MKKIQILCIAVLTGIALIGCKQKSKPAQKQVQTPSKTSSSSGAQKSEATWALHAYEVIRKALADDDLKTTQLGAKSLIQQAAKQSSSAHSKILNKMVSAAQKIVRSSHFPEARLAFGELSKHTIVWLKTSGHSKGIQTYQCPMAKGYKKWLQYKSPMANPYMGKHMLRCGGPTSFAP